MRGGGGGGGGGGSRSRCLSSMLSPHLFSRKTRHGKLSRCESERLRDRQIERPRGYRQTDRRTGRGESEKRERERERETERQRD